MRLYEYEGIELFRREAIPVPDYALAASPAEAREKALQDFLRDFCGQSEANLISSHRDRQMHLVRIVGRQTGCTHHMRLTDLVLR